MEKFTFLSLKEFYFQKPKSKYATDYPRPITNVVQDKKGNKFFIDNNTMEYKKIKNPLYTILKQKDITTFYDDRIEIIKKNGHQCYMTDFAILLGGKAELSVYSTIENGRTMPCSFLQLTRNMSNNERTHVMCIDANGNIHKELAKNKYNSARPMTKYSEISSLATNEKINKNGILEVEYGEYPQMVAFEDLSKILEENYLRGKLKKTGKIYTTNKQSQKSDWYYDKKFEERKHEEFEYNGKKYIRFVIFYESMDKKLSDGRTTKLGKPYWIEVMPIKWLVDKEEDIALSKFALFSGISIEGIEKNIISPMRMFLYKYFENDIIPSVTKEKNKGKQTKGEQLSKKIDEIEEYLLPNEEKDIITNQIKELVINYNKELENLKNIEENDIQLGRETPDILYQKLYMELDIILDKSKNKYHKTKHYYDIINILDTIILMIKENKITTTDNELINTFKTIIFDVIPLIKINNNLKEDILNILLDEKNKIETILKNKEYYQYENIKEWEISFRMQIEQILLTIINTNNKQDIATILNQYLSDSLPKINDKYTDKLVAFHIKELIKIADEIKNKTSNPQYLKTLEEILSLDLEELKTLEETIKYLSDKIIELHKLNYEVKEDIKDIEEINDYKISL